MSWAFRGPANLAARLDGLDAGRIAAMEPDALVAVFQAKPALHRYPGSMGKRTHALCAFIVETYDGDAGEDLDHDRRPEGAAPAPERTPRLRRGEVEDLPRARWASGSASPPRDGSATPGPSPARRHARSPTWTRSSHSSACASGRRRRRPRAGASPTRSSASVRPKPLTCAAAPRSRTPSPWRAPKRRATRSLPTPHRFEPSSSRTARPLPDSSARSTAT